MIAGENDRDGCVFCRILAGLEPAHFVYQDELVVGFLSVEQPNPYKVLVVPRAHLPMVYDLDDRRAAAIFQATVRIARAVRAASGCQGMNLVQSNGRAGQQDVDHFHLHIVPRYAGDAVVLDWDNDPQPAEQLARLAAEIRRQLEPPPGSRD